MNEQEMPACKIFDLGETEEENECDMEIEELSEDDDDDDRWKTTDADRWCKKFEEQQRKEESFNSWWKLFQDEGSEFCVVNGLGGPTIAGCLFC